MKLCQTTSKRWNAALIAAAVRAQQSNDQALIAHLKLPIKKLNLTAFPDEASIGGASTILSKPKFSALMTNSFFDYVGHNMRDRREEGLGV